MCERPDNWLRWSRPQTARVKEHGRASTRLVSPLARSRWLARCTHLALARVDLLAGSLHELKRQHSMRQYFDFPTDALVCRIWGRTDCYLVGVSTAVVDSCMRNDDDDTHVDVRQLGCCIGGSECSSSSVVDEDRSSAILLLLPSKGKAHSRIRVATRTRIAWALRHDTRMQRMDGWMERSVLSSRHATPHHYSIR